MATPYNPGQYKKREFDPALYKPHQEARYQAYSTAYYALYGDRLNTLRPTPGFCYDPEKFSDWKKKFLIGGLQEAGSRGLKVARGLTEDDYPDSVWVWLYQRMLAAEELNV